MSAAQKGSLYENTGHVGALLVLATVLHDRVFVLQDTFTETRGQPDDMQ